MKPNTMLQRMALAISVLFSASSLIGMYIDTSNKPISVEQWHTVYKIVLGSLDNQDPSGDFADQEEKVSRAALYALSQFHIAPLYASALVRKKGSLGMKLIDGTRAELVPRTELIPAALLKRAIKNKMFPLARNLIETQKVDVFYNDSEAFIEAAKQGDVGLLELFITKGANVHVRNNAPLIKASSRGRLEVVRILLTKGADISAQQSAALVGAVENNKYDVIPVLAAAGANIHAQSDAPFIFATSSGELKTFHEVIRAWTGDVPPMPPWVQDRAGEPFKTMYQKWQELGTDGYKEKYQRKPNDLSFFWRNFGLDSESRANQDSE